MHCVRAAAARTFCTAGTNKAINIAMIAITTSNSISVKPNRNFLRDSMENSSKKMKKMLVKPNVRRVGLSREESKR
jgi:hypothetical protein